jgi:hypothetical protein
MTADDIVRALVSGKFSYDELQKVRQGLVFATNQTALTNRSQIVVGSSVKFTNSRSGQVIAGTVTKIMRKNALIKTSTTNWRVPVAMLSSN